MLAVGLLREDVGLRDALSNSQDDPPMIFLEEMEEVEQIPEDIEGGGTGYAFYPEDTDG